jgi:hypothetical protein
MSHTAAVSSFTVNRVASIGFAQRQKFYTAAHCRAAKYTAEGELPFSNI